MNEHTIKMIALDLDGTTLDSHGKLAARTRNALAAAIEKGTQVVIATGRALSALPAEILDIPGIRYLLTSNGASIMDVQKEEAVYSNCIASEALRNAVSVLKGYDFMMEVFVLGHAYVEKGIFERVQNMNFTEKHRNYILLTRKPVEGLMDFALSHDHLVENINVNFENQTDRSMMREVLGKLPGVTLTTSFDHNLELGGATTSKAGAIRHLCEMLGIAVEEVMACGDSPNDMAMLQTAGFPVAMGNAKEEVKAVAAFVTATNDEEGVADVIERFVL